MPDTPRRDDDHQRGSLRPYLGHLSPAQAGGVLESVLAALTDAHANGVVHGQLKPEHVLVMTDGRVQVVDFGVPDAPVASVSVATAAYMAPEQPMQGDIGPWTDLYSVGCLAHALFTGQAPYGESGPAVLHLLQHVNEPVVRAPDVDPRLADWIESLLVKDPAARPRGAGDAWGELEAILIALLGPSWRRDAALPPDPPDPPPPGIICIDMFEPPTGGQSWDAPPEPSAMAQPAPAHPGAETHPAPAHLAAATAPTPARPAAEARPTPARPADGTQPASARPAASSPQKHARPGWTLSAAFAGGVAAIAIAAGALAAGGPSPRPATIIQPTEVSSSRSVDARGAERDGLRTGARAKAATHRSAGIARVIKWLERRERVLAPALDGPRRIAATKRLWWAYVGAAKRLRQVDVPLADRELRGQLAEALRLAGCAYGRAASADRAGYARERALALAEQANAAAAVDGLATVGYELPAGAAKFTRLP